MKKKWAFTAAAGVLGGLFLAGVLEVGSSTGWFGLEELASQGFPRGSTPMRPPGTPLRMEWRAFPSAGLLGPCL